MKGFSIDAGFLSNRACAIAATLVVHGLAFYGLARANNFVLTTSSKPIEVSLISETAKPENWQPPTVQVVNPPVTTAVPDISLAMIVEQAPKNAISTAAVVQKAPAAEQSAGMPRELSVVEYVREPTPHYPSASRRQRAEGAVLLRVLVDESGHARDIQIYRSSGHRSLDEAARDAVAQALFKPYVENGVTRSAFVMIPIEFSLNRQS